MVEGDRVVEGECEIGKGEDPGEVERDGRVSFSHFTINKGLSENIYRNDGRKDELDSDAPRKRRKMDQARLDASQADWVAFEQKIAEFEIQHVQGKGKFAFSFVEGPLVKALRSGNWYALRIIFFSSYTFILIVCCAGSSWTRSISQALKRWRRCQASFMGRQRPSV